MFTANELVSSFSSKKPVMYSDTKKKGLILVVNKLKYPACFKGAQFSPALKGKANCCNITSHSL